MDPPSWTNPRAVGPYDLMVVGGDALGVLAAEFAHAAGARVALASDHPLGMDAIGAAARTSLALAAKGARAVGAASRWGWPAAARGAFDFKAWRQAADRFARHAALRFSAERLQERGVDVHLGPLTFQSPGSLRVAGQSLSFGRALVAPHADRAPPTIPGLAELDYLTPDNLGRLTYWPRHWAIVGSDAVACELAQTLVSLGSTVDFVAHDRLLADANLEIGAAHCASTGGSGGASIASLVARRLAADGVRMWLGCTVAEAARTGAAKSLLVEQDGKRQIIVADEILVITHRRLDIEWLRLDLAGVATDGCDIVADTRLCTANNRVAAVPARELPDLPDREAMAALARLAADAGLGCNHRSTPVLAPRRLRFDPPIAWIGDCGVARNTATDSHVTPPADALLPHDDWRPEPATPPVERNVPIASSSTPFVGKGVDFGSMASCEDVAMGDSPAADFRTMECELRLRVDSRRRRLLGAIVVGAEAQWLVGPLTQMIVDGSRGAEHFAGRAELEWLARLVAGQETRARPRIAWWRRIGCAAGPWLGVDFLKSRE